MIQCGGGELPANQIPTIADIIEKHVKSCKLRYVDEITKNCDHRKTCVNLPKYVIRRLSNSLKIYFEYHTVLRTVKRTD